MTRIYVIRHGKAQRDAPSGLDEDRDLKGRGERQAAWIAQHLSTGDEAPTLVLTSRFVRARRTAEPIAEACGCHLEEIVELECGHATSEVIALIESYVEQGRDEPLAIVGHNPTLSDVVETMCRSAATDSMWLRTGEAAVLDCETGYTALVELLRLEE